MALSRVKTWVSGEVLTASDLNAEFNNILNNARSLISPLTGTLDMDGYELILDGDADTSLTADTDDRVDVRLGGVDLFRFDGTAASLVNGIDFIGAATSARPRVVVVGSDTNVGLALRPKGTGSGASVVIEDGNGNEVLIGDVATASAVNELTATNAATGNRPVLKASGGDTNVGLGVRPKGTGAGASVVIEDGNGNEVLIADVATASAVNEVTITNAATGAGPTLAATGGDTNIPVTLKGKGTGKVVLGQATSTEVQHAADQPITDSSGNELLKFVKTASAVNEVTVTNNSTGNAPSLSATGGDTNISLNLVPKGTGTVQANGKTLALELIQPQTVSGVATVDFTTGIDSTYDNYIILMHDVVPATDNVDLWLRMDTNGGASFDAGASDYAWTNVGNTDAGGTAGASGDIADAQIRLALGLDNGATASLVGRVEIYGVNSSRHKWTNNHCTWFRDASTIAAFHVGGRYLNTSAVNAFRILTSSGNISGTFILYGVRKS